LEAIGNPGGRPADDSKTLIKSNPQSHDQREHLPSLYLLLLFLVLAAGIITAGYLFYRGYARHFRGEVERGLSSIAELKVGQLVHWRKERLADASVFYRNKAFSGLVERLLETPADMDVRGRILSWLDRVQDAYQYDRVFILDAQGIERLAVPGTPEPVASHLLQQIPEILRSNKIVFLDFHRDTSDRPIHLTLVVPVREESDGGRPLGVIVLRIDPATYLYPFIQQWPLPSRTGETLLIRREGDEALYLNELRFRKNSALSLRVPLNKGNVPAVKAALGQEGIVEGVDYRGVPVLADVRGIPDSPWFLVARMDIAEVNVPLWERLWLIIGLVAVLLFSAGAGAGLIWRQQRIRFFRERLAAAKRAYAVSSRQEALLSAVPDIIMEVDQNKIYIWANPAGTEFFGEDAIGKEAAFYFEGEQETYQIVKPLFNGQDDVIYVESWQRRKDGEKRLLAWWCRVLKDDGGRVTGAISSAHDITERKRAEEALRESEERFRTLYENSTIGLYRTTPDGRIHLANPALIRMLGYSSFDDLSNRDLEKNGFEPSYPRTQFVEIIEKDGEVKGLESAWKRKDGTIFFVRESARAIRDSQAKTLYYDGTVEDITERKRAEEALRESERILREHERALRERNDELVRFNYAVSHDLKSPLVTIQTFLGYLEQDVRKPGAAGVDKDLEYIRTASDKMSRLLNELLELSQVGHRMNPPVEAPLQAIVKEALGLAAGRIAERGVRVKVTKKPILLCGDRPRLVEVFQNLVDNAVKFMGDQPVPLVEIGAEQADDEIVLFVRDNGIGIDQRHQSKLFGLFEKLDPGSGGTGIGLALVKRIVEVHGGKIWVESEGPGQGAMFRFTLAKTRRLPR